MASLFGRTEHFVLFGRVHHEEQFCEMIYSCVGEQNYLCNFGRGNYWDHSCEIILNLDQRFRRRCPLKKIVSHDEQTDHKSLP